MRLKLRLCNVVAPFLGIVFYWNAEVYLEAEDVIIDGFRGGIYVLGGEIINDVVCVFGMVFVGVGV